MVAGGGILDPVMTRVETVLVDIGLDDGVGLDVNGVSTAVGFDT